VSPELIAEALRTARAALGGVLDVDALNFKRVIAPALDAMARAEAALATAASTERKLGVLEQRIQELEQALVAHDEFLSTLGHELRNPLSPIFMQAQYLLDTARHVESRTLPTDWLIPRLEVFCRRLRRFLEMLNRIMDVSRISAGRLTLEHEEVDLGELVREVSASFERELSAARSELVLDVPQAVTGTWDRLRLEQIFTNLLSNAIRYGASKPIEISISADGSEARLSVKDHGIGIAEADQGRIFQRFERVGKARTSGGFGIGLWTVRQSCLAMGGSVHVKSQLGSGAEFIVTLPRHVRRAHG
jgi:signal transduction histidine kinase